MRKISTPAITGLALLAALAVTTACSSSSTGTSTGNTTSNSAALPTVTVAVASGELTPIPNGIIQLGVRTGAFDKLGVHVKLIELQGSAQTVQALVSGQADVANMDTSDAIDLVASKQLDVRAIVSNGANPDYVFVASKSITGIKGLTGTTFAGEDPGSQPQLLLNYILQENGVSASAVSTLSLGTPLDRVLAVVNHRAEATIVSAAQWASLSAAQQSCCHLLLDEGGFIQAAPLEAKVNVATTKTIQTKAKALQLFTTALIKLSRMYYQDPSSWAQGVAQARSDLTLSALQAQAAKPSFHDQWCVNGCMNAGLLQNTSALLYKGSELNKLPRIPLSAWADYTFVSNSLKQLGPMPGLDPVQAP